MRPFRALIVAVSLFVIGTAAAAPITPTNGESFLLAYGSGGSPVYQFNSTYGPLGSFNPGPFNLPADSSSVSYSAPGQSSSAAFNHTAGTGGITISGHTAAATTAAGMAVAQGSPDSDGIISTLFGFGYYIVFHQNADGYVRIDANGQTATTGDGGYADFGVRVLIDGTSTQLYSFGGTSSSSTSDLLFLPVGDYAFFVQSQSAASGAGSSGDATFTASLTPLDSIPEPVSVAVFGGLILAGGLAAARRRQRAV